ncbi:MAG: glycosyltransferase, partial [Planctomycetes bacterium]|nr:glycosyltransferase [Planctomycetota bacterium]
MRRFTPFVLAAVIPVTLLTAFSLPTDYLFDPLMLPLQAFLLGLVFYQMGIALFGFRRPRPVGAAAPASRFAVLIAAHNEEAVIAQLVSSVRRQEYPSALFSVFVIADNCTDRTAEVAGAAGAGVHERFDTTRRGKGPAIDWMLHRLWESGESYDAILIFDADNVVSPTFLRVMDAHLSRGDQVIQGYLGTKNPTDSWITRAIYTDYVYTNRFFQHAKVAAGLSASLGGTGLCIAMPLLRQLGWRCASLTEDLEFQMRAILAGVRPTWAHDAIVYDEKPIEFKTAWRQRKRWMQGHASVAVRYLLPLFARAFRRRDPVAFDAALYLGSPVWYSLALVGGLIQLGNVLTPLYAFLYPMWLSLGLIAVSYVLPYVALRAEGCPAHLYLWPSTLAARFVLGLCWAPLSALGLLQHRNRHWDKTTHTRSLTLVEAQSQVASLAERAP